MNLGYSSKAKIYNPRVSKGIVNNLTFIYYIFKNKTYLFLTLIIKIILKLTKLIALFHYQINI